MLYPAMMVSNHLLDGLANAGKYMFCTLSLHFYSNAGKYMFCTLSLHFYSNAGKYMFSTLFPYFLYQRSIPTPLFKFIILNYSC